MFSTSPRFVEYLDLCAREPQFWTVVLCCLEECSKIPEGSVESIRMLLSLIFNHKSSITYLLFEFFSIQFKRGELAPDKLLSAAAVHLTISFRPVKRLIFWSLWTTSAVCLRQILAHRPQNSRERSTSPTTKSTRSSDSDNQASADRWGDWQTG